PLRGADANFATAAARAASQRECDRTRDPEDQSSTIHRCALLEKGSDERRGMARSLGTERVERTILCPRGTVSGDSARRQDGVGGSARTYSALPSPPGGSARIYPALASPPGGSARIYSALASPPGGSARIYSALASPPGGSARIYSALASPPGGSARIYSALASPPGGSARTATRGQAFEVQLGHAPVHAVGHDARGATGHRPAHAAVAAVEEEVAVAAETEDGRAIWRHGAEARAVLASLVVDGVGEDLPGEAQNVVEVARRPAPVVPGELRGGREAQLIAEPRPGHQPLLVHARQGGGETAAPQGKGRRVALGGIDGQTDARRARHDGAAHAEGQHVVVRGVTLAVAGEDSFDVIAAALERGDASAQPHVHPEAIATERAQPFREEARVAARIAEVADGP